MEIQATKIFTASRLKQQRIVLGWYREPRVSSHLSFQAS